MLIELRTCALPGRLIASHCPIDSVDSSPQLHRTDCKEPGAEGQGGDESTRARGAGGQDPLNFLGLRAPIISTKDFKLFSLPYTIFILMLRNQHQARSKALM